MGDCKELSTQTCPDCLSGQRECEKLENQCWINGLCQGRLIEEVRYFSENQSHRSILYVITVYCHHVIKKVYVDGNIRNPALPVMPRQYQKFFINNDP